MRFERKSGGTKGVLLRPDSLPCGARALAMRGNFKKWRKLASRKEQVGDSSSSERDTGTACYKGEKWFHWERKSNLYENLLILLRRSGRG